MSGSGRRVAAAAADAGAFAEALLGQPLWPHQLELARSSARYRVVCAGRQVGKSRGLAVIALHEAATRRNVTVLLVSAGEVASQRLLEECAALASGSPLLRGSVLDESKSQLTLSNGSRILSVPASQRQIRGWAVDLLIVDEAAFVDDQVWRAAEPAIIARPGSRVILCSTPWGGVDNWFRRLWQRGMDAPDDLVSSWHLPSTVSPLVDAALVEHWRSTWPALEFATEVLAEWADESGAYFTADELEQAVADYELLTPAAAREESLWSGSGAQRVLPAVAGVDWGMARDANALVLLSPLDDFGLNDDRLGRGGRVLFVPWLEARSRWAWAEFIDYVVDVASAFLVEVTASETNGVGAFPTDELRDRLWRRWGGRSPVAPVWTDVRRKQSGFGKLKGLLQRGQLVLPRHPELLKQLRALEYEQLTGGSVRISVPERAGHDDLAMALMQAVSCVQPNQLAWRAPGVAWWDREGHADAAREYVRSREGRLAAVESGELEVVRTGSGLLVPRRALPAVGVGRAWLTFPEGAEAKDPW